MDPDYDPHEEPIDVRIEHSLAAEADYQAKLERERELERELELELEREYWNQRAEEALREEDEAEQGELDFDIESAIAATEEEGQDAEAAAALSQHNAQMRLLDSVRADNEVSSTLEILAHYGEHLSLVLLERSRNAQLHEDTRDGISVLVGLLRSVRTVPDVLALTPLR
jgi:hypothetical protein